ncbi:RNA polymerase sigma factor [Arachidicoccus soli]|uniref:RNA polymerase sigma factor n=1 Tax=Arachidicoccus soli TaxID=2341117 RepID=A0A386HQU0_9BACT|nr:sigma-70 family RNA polymerase sigma factor [Arachidicoccus soli]AYD48318.1 sigma-70 family RNA polymerase sigma factor [Arachidicoccus soli]
MYNNSRNIINEHEELLSLKNGNEHAFEIIYNRYSLSIYRRLIQMVKIENVAEELTQDVFVKIWEKRHLIDPDQLFFSYLNKIAANLVVDFYRKVSRDERLKKSIADISTKMEEPLDFKIIHEEDISIIQKAIKNLPTQQQNVYELCKIEGHTYEEASRLLGISTATINNHIVRATKSLKNYLNKNYHLVLIIFFISGVR